MSERNEWPHRVVVFAAEDSYWKQTRSSLLSAARSRLTRGCNCFLQPGLVTRRACAPRAPMIQFALICSADSTIIGPLSGHRDGLIHLCVCARKPHCLAPKCAAKSAKVKSSRHTQQSSSFDCQRSRLQARLQWHCLCVSSYLPACHKAGDAAAGSWWLTANCGLRIANGSGAIDVRPPSQPTRLADSLAGWLAD